MSILRTLKRFLRAIRIAATDKRIPRPLRLLAGLGLAPIPGPFDEALLVIVAIPIALFYRRPLAEAWKEAGLMPTTLDRPALSTQPTRGSRSV